MADIFISYSRKNKAAAEHLVQTLERMRHNVRYDQDHSGGHAWWEAILQDIRASKIVIVALSYDYLDSYPCSLEYDYAEALGKLILPVMVSPVDFGKLPLSIVRVNVVDFTKPTDREQLLDLTGSLNDLANQPTPPPPNPLPTPPSAPIPRVNSLLESITDYSVELTASEQEAFTNELLDLYLKPGTRENARFALDKLRKRPELRTRYAERIDGLLALSTSQLKIELSQKPPPGRLPLWLMAIIALIVVGGIILIAARTNSGTVSTMTSQPATVAQISTEAITPTSTPTASDAPSPTFTLMPTSTPTATYTPSRTLAPTATVTFTPILTMTSTPSLTFTLTATASPTTTATFVPTPRLRIVEDGISQVWVPAGCFMMGSDPAKDMEAQGNEQPTHAVCITQGFWLDQFEVTNASFQRFIDAGGYTTREYWSQAGWINKGSADTSGACAGEPDEPRVCVTWFEAEAYANWRNGRLPTEAEWEYAARGQQAFIYPWGDLWDSNKANADNNLGRRVTVDSYSNGKSWVGAYNMSGNVWEWVSDWYGEDYYEESPKNDPTGPADGFAHVVRGGSWFHSGSFSRAAFRSYSINRSNLVGFRIIGLAFG